MTSRASSTAPTDNPSDGRRGSQGEPCALRSRADALVEKGDAHGALQVLRRLWRLSPDPATGNFIVGRYGKIRRQVADQMLVSRVAILRSFTVEPMVPMLRAGALAGGIDAHVYLSEFGAYVQEILDPQSALYDFAPDVVILAVQTRDLVPDLWFHFPELTPDRIDQLAGDAVALYADLVAALRKRLDSHLILHALETPAVPSLGVYDRLAERSQIETIQNINIQLAAFTRSKPNTYMLDYDRVLARCGFDRVHDERKWLAVRMPIKAGEMIGLVNEWLRFLHPIAGRICKCLVLDLDNTLWGGVIGEEGMDGIKLDTEYPGAAFQAFQRAVLELLERGIILAINSKNNLHDAMEAIEKHPGMLLRPEHFAALRINWTDKASNLREIAQELNIGIDSLAVFDDNPVEREWMSTQVPEALIIDVPCDPMLYADTLRATPEFERLSVTREDRVRGRLYASNRRRGELQQRCRSLPEFYESLKMEIEFMGVTASNLPRVVQLTQKTNQFNLTTHRYSEAQVLAMAGDPAWQLHAIRARDSYGDNGVVGVAFARHDRAVAMIDTLLISCRVIGRSIETAFLWYVVDRAMAAGAVRISGWYLPTKKNLPCKDFYPAHGFTLSEQSSSGQCLYELDPRTKPIQWPSWIGRIN